MTAHPRAQNVLGAVLLTVSWVFFTTEMVLARILAENLSLFQIAAVRLATQAAILAPVIVITGFAVMRTARLPLHIVRAILSVSGMVLFYLTFALLPVAMATTLTFTTSMFLMVLAALILGETIGPRRITAVAVCFVGVLVVMRPGFVGFDPVMLVALAGAAVAALLMVVTRALSSTESRITIMAYSACLGLVLMSVPAAVFWEPASADQWAMLGVLSLSGTVGQFLMVSAFQVAEASALAPVDYVRLIFAVIAGYTIFAEIPDIWTWAGAVIIVTSVAAATHFERLAARRAQHN